MIKKLIYSLCAIFAFAILSSTFLVAKSCKTNDLMLMNSLHSDIKITLSIRSSALENDKQVFEKVIRTAAPQDIAVFSDVAEFIYKIKVEDLKTSKVYEQIDGGYVAPNDGDKHLFLIDHTGIHHHVWQMFDVGVYVGSIMHGLYFISNELSCLDGR